MDLRLKALAKRLPDSNDQFSTLLALSDHKDASVSTDRVAAIVASQFVEHATKKAIESHFHAGSYSEKDLFDGPSAPLGGFSAKISVARALGIISDSEREDLDTIRNIRNAFAHSMTHIDFSDQEVADLCGALHGYEPATLSPLTRALMGNRKVFVAVCSMIYFGLTTYAPGIGGFGSLAEIMAR